MKNLILFALAIILSPMSIIPADNPENNANNGKLLRGSRYLNMNSCLSNGDSNTAGSCALECPGCQAIGSDICCAYDGTNTCYVWLAGS